MNSLQPVHWYLRPGTSMSHLVEVLSKVLDVEFFDEKTVSTTLLDDYDHDLWHADEVLLMTAKNVMRLYSGDDVLEITGVSSKCRFWWDLPDSNVKDLLKERLDLRALVPVAEIGLASQGFVLRNEDEKIVVRGEFNALSSQLSDITGDDINQTRISSFVTLYPLRGYESELKQAGDIVGQLAEAAPESLSLKERINLHGFDFNSKSSNFGITENEPAEQAVREMALAMLHAARENEQGVIDDIDTEFLHQYRVSLRKTRSLLNLMKKVFPIDLHLRLKTLLGDLASSTNQQRDLDVFLLERNRYASMLPDNFQEGIGILFRLIATDREKARKAVERTFKSAEYHLSFTEITGLLEKEALLATKTASKPVFEVAGRKIYTRYIRICEMGRLINTDTPDEQVHELRIECKKLRYMMEFFMELYPKKRIKKLIKSLKVLQTVLGDFNDYSVQKLFLSDYEKSHGKKPALSAAINGLIAVLHQKQLMARSMVQQTFDDFNQPDINTEFTELFHSDSREKPES